MPKFQILQPTTSQLYWFELASYVAPYATVGSFLITAGMAFFHENDNEARHEAIMQKLNEISQQIEDLRLSLERKIDDMILKERTGEVLGIRESLEEYKLLKAQGVLDNIISDSAQTKQKIASYLDSPDTTLEYYLAYNALKCLLLPLRIATFGLFKIDSANLRVLTKDELRDLLLNRQTAINHLIEIGRNRVTYDSEVIMIDELGPRYGTELWVDVDGKGVWGKTFSPPPNDHNELRDEQEKVFTSTRDTMAATTSQPLVDFYTKVQSWYNSIP